MNHNLPAYPAAITGMGIITGLGCGVDAFRDAMFCGKQAFKTLDYPPLSFSVVGSIIEENSIDDCQKCLPTITQKLAQRFTKILRKAPFHLKLSALTALEAWLQADLKEDPANVGIIVAGQNMGCHYQYDLYQKFRENPDYLSPSYALNFLDSNSVGTISELLDIHGDSFSVGGSFATGNLGLIRGLQLIQDRRLKACLVVSTPPDLSPMELQGFRNIGAMGGYKYLDRPNLACRPFDKYHEGFIYGQGAGAMLLESVESANKRGAHILGYLQGGASLLDANRLTNPNLEGEISAMQQALDSANLTVKDVDYINTHGTSAPLGDQTEILAIKRVLGKRCQEVPVNSTKSLTGHCLWSAGMVEAIATVIQIHDGFVHPTRNLEHPISQKINFITNKVESLQIENALSNSFGFGGFNSSIVLSKSPRG